jgi:hypothetical protein
MIAFKTQSQNPSPPSGIPSVWPWVELIIESDQATLYQSLGYTCLSADAYVLYKADFQASYDTWLDSLPTQFNTDLDKYLKRAASQQVMIAKMAAGNISRHRSALWTDSDLILLTQDPELVAVMNDINALAFEIAYVRVDAITNALITSEIKAEWKALLYSNFYN